MNSMRRNPERFARYVTALRAHTEEHRACCGKRLSWQIVERARRRFAGARVTTTMVADEILIMTMSPRDPDYHTRSARSARWLFRGLSEYVQRRAA